MSNFVPTKRLIFVTAALAAVGLTGCGTGGATGLSTSVTLDLPDGTTTEATLGAGVASLANSTWSFSQSFPSGGTASAPFMTISFGPDGELTSFEDNTISPEIFGDTILFDGQRHETSQAGLSYAAATFGAETSDASGFAFVGELNAYAPILGTVATATATADGQFDPDDPDVMTGSFSFVADVVVELPGVPTDTIEQTFDYRAQRVN